MDVTPQHQDPATGDDELAKVLAGVSDDPNTQQSQVSAAGLQFEETPAPGAPAAPAAPAEPAKNTPAHAAPAAEEPALPIGTTISAPMAAPATSGGALEAIKRNALEELRPLVDKLNLPPEEKFDTLLLIIRSTDDQSLVEAAHEAAKGITDEVKRAQALLDVIKEIDYFSTPHPTQQ